jgi:hypothetical protein
VRVYFFHIFLIQILIISFINITTKIIITNTIIFQVLSKNKDEIQKKKDKAKIIDKTHLFDNPKSKSL